MTSYVYDGTEVVLTGRKADRIVSNSTRARSRRTPSSGDELVEITPKDNETGSWTKFVREKELYIITEQ